MFGSLASSLGGLFSSDFGSNAAAITHGISGSLGKNGGFDDGTLKDVAGGIGWGNMYDEGYFEGLEDTEGYHAVPQDTGFVRPNDISEYTPEFVAAHRDELGIPPGAPVQDFFAEFVAHQVTGTSGRRSHRLEEIQELPEAEREAAMELYTQERSMLEAWGYNPDVSEDNEVYDPETGLYALRYDPLDPDSGVESVVSFRGTQPTEGLNDGNEDRLGQDLLTDLDPEVGQRQYDANAEEIAALMHGGTGAEGRSMVTGHSLGGYLAQRAAAENTDAVSDVVTFQAGGIDDDHAQQFRENNADGHVDVRHHTTNYDFVNWAGEEKLDGTHFEHVTDDFSAGNFGHLRGLMFGAGEGGPEGMLQVLSGERGTTESETDPIDPRWRHLAEGVRTGAGGLGQVVGAVPFGLNALSEGIDNMENNVLAGIGNTAGTFWDGLANTGGNALDALGNTGSALWDGDFGGALSSAGSGLMGLGGDLWDTASGTAGSALDTGIGAVTDTAGAVWDGLSTTGGMLGRGALQLFNSAGHIGRGLGGYAADTDLVHGLSDAAGNAWEGVGNTADTLLGGVSNTAGNALSSVTNTVGELASGDLIGAGLSAGSGALQLGSDVLSTAGDTLGSAWDTGTGLVADTGGALWDGASELASGAASIWDRGIMGSLFGASDD